MRTVPNLDEESRGQVRLRLSYLLQSADRSFFLLLIISFTRCDMVVFGEACTPDSEYIVEPFTMAFVTCAVLNGIDFARAPGVVLRGSRLGAYAGFAHLSVNKSAEQATCDRFVFYNNSSRDTPWGFRLPLQCISCRCMVPWKLVRDRSNPDADITSSTLLRYECGGYIRPLNARSAYSGSTKCRHVIVYRRAHAQELTSIIDTEYGHWMKMALLHGDFVREEHSNQ